MEKAIETSKALNAERNKPPRREEDWFDPNRDPGNEWTDKPLHVRLRQARDQWINLGERQRWMFDNFILSAEWLEEKLRRAEAKNGK